jgi:CubicO group peptidase (beta-lactamase class C family)
MFSRLLGRSIPLIGLLLLVSPLALLLTMPAPVAAQKVDSAAIDALLKDDLRFWKSPGMAVVIVRGDQVVYLNGLGVRDINGKDPVTPDTVFPLASCSKAFTALAVAMLVDTGKMSWDDPVRKHVEFFHLSDPLADANVTIRDLMCHRTGVGSHDLLWYRTTRKREEIIRALGYLKPNKSFRSAFQYQSSMFTVAGQAVSVASGGSWSDFIRRRIFEPLEMTGSSLTTRAALQAKDHAMPHHKTAAGKIESIPWYRFDYPEPAGSVNVTARDLGKWLQFQLGDGTYRGKRLVSAENFEEPHRAQFALRVEGMARAINPFTHQLSYGLAWVVQDYRGHLMLSHAGAIDGFRAHITLLPNEKLGIAVLNNLQWSRLTNAASNQLVDLILGATPAMDWNAHFAQLDRWQEEASDRQALHLLENRHKGTKPTHELTAYTGAYEEPAYGAVRVSLEKDALIWEWGTFRLSLVHFHYDTFTAKHDSLFGKHQLVFTLGADGNVAGFKMFDVDFKKKE